MAFASAAPCPDGGGGTSVGVLFFLRLSVIITSSSDTRVITASVALPTRALAGPFYTPLGPTRSHQALTSLFTCLLVHVVHLHQIQLRRVRVLGRPPSRVVRARQLCRSTCGLCVRRRGSPIGVLASGCGPVPTGSARVPPGCGSCALAMRRWPSCRHTASRIG